MITNRNQPSDGTQCLTLNCKIKNDKNCYLTINLIVYVLKTDWLG